MKRISKKIREEKVTVFNKLFASRIIKI